ncbi:MAG: HlyD family secretion protein [Mediterranea sp.]|jgi:hypothetical protein|nr:HlyD family secretion protein [Mediterranea sp.]
MAEKDKIELRSEKVRNIIGRVPPWLIRSGIGYLALLVLALLIAAWYIPYPENLRVEARVEKNEYGVLRAVVKLPYRYLTQVEKGMPVELEMEGYDAAIYGYIDTWVHEVDPKVVMDPDGNYFRIEVDTRADSLKYDRESRIRIVENMKAACIICLSHKTILQKMLGW